MAGSAILIVIMRYLSGAVFCGGGMQFVACEPTEAVDLLAWRSAGGRFELGFHRVAFGIRVVVSSERFYHVNYCIGLNFFHALLVFGAVRLALSSIDESTPRAHIEIEQMFPWQDRKPMDLDPECLTVILRLAGASLDAGAEVEQLEGQMLMRQLADAFNQSSDRLRHMFSNIPENIQSGS